MLLNSLEMSKSEKLRFIRPINMKEDSGHKTKNKMKNRNCDVVYICQLVIMIQVHCAINECVVVLK